MDILLRVIAIFIEVVILAGIIYSLLTGVCLIIFDLGIGSKYKKMVTAAMIMVGCLMVVFCIAHLTFLYPVIPAR